MSDKKRTNRRGVDRRDLLSAGAAAHAVHLKSDDGYRRPVYHGAIPIRAEALWSVDPSRAHQLRAAAEYSACAGRCSNSWRLSAGYAQVWSDDQDHQLLWRVSVEQESHGRLLTLGLEWNRW